jgi:aspartokinase/homoserine dehydrogenase 1
MKKIVVKFGGSNLKRVQDVTKLLRVIKNYSKPIVIVISALYGVTDLLLKVIEEVKGGERVIKRFVGQLFQKHLEIIENYIQDENLQSQAIGKLEKRIQELEKYLLGIYYIGEIPDFAKDRVLSYGERFSSLVLDSVLHYHHIESQERLPEEIGLYTDGEHGNGSIDFEMSRDRVTKALRGAKISIIPGFYGVSKDGRITLLGRGGSDYSAAAIARCINAESVDLWKDVPGFMSADPKCVEKPMLIGQLTYREAAELSYFGAKILHPRTFDPIMDREIPVRIFNIESFNGSINPTTIIGGNGIVKKGVVKSVTFSDDIGILRVSLPGGGIKPGIMATLTNQLARENINIKSIISAQTAINILLSKKDMEQGLHAIKDAGIFSEKEVTVKDFVSLVAVVGIGLLEQPGIAARIFSAVSYHGINVQIISLGASSVATYFIVHQKDRDKAIQAIHHEFFPGNVSKGG